MFAKLLPAPLMVALLSSPALATCNTTHYHFMSNGDTVSANAALSSGDTCFHGLRNNTRTSNIFTSVSVAQNPSHGIITVGGGAFQYRSQRGYVGQDRYAMKICMKGPRGQGCSVVAFDATIQ